MSRVALALAGLVALGTASPANAHEVLHLVERNRAVALKAYFPDGEVLAYAQYEVYAPVDPKIPYQKGRTDRGGWLAFVPDAPGKYRVKVIDNTGHGLEVEIDAAPRGAPTAESSAESGALPLAAFVLRPLVGVAAIALVFAGLLVLYRRRRTTR